MSGGSELEIAVAAAEQGWDYPPLLAVFQGHITEKGAWEDEIPEFADDLAEIRLRILERQGRFEEYLNLAEAEGQFMLYLQMLIRLGRNEQAFTEARDYLTEPGAVLTVARALAEHGDRERALELAAHGLTLKSAWGRSALAEWLRDEAQACGRTDLALQAAWQALQDNTCSGELPLAPGAPGRSMAGPPRRCPPDCGLQHQPPGCGGYLPLRTNVPGSDGPGRPAPLARGRGQSH